MLTFRTLFREGLLPANVQIIGNARSDSTIAKIRSTVDPYVGLKDNAERAKYDQFWKIVHYVKGSSTSAKDMVNIETALKPIESGKKVANRLFYLALPPSIYAGTATALHASALSKT